MLILLTGATGFAGGHLTEALLASGGAEIVGLSRTSHWPPHWQHLAGRVSLRECDLCHPQAMDRMLQAVQPEQIYHLAGYASPGRSFSEPDAAWAGNLTATRTLYDAVVRWGGRPRILFIGSGLIYGDSDDPRTVLVEDSPLRPNNPYATSKAAADLLSYQYTVQPRLDIMRARPCNHIGPRQLPYYAVASFARQVVAIERGQAPPVLETGNLTPQRDLTDVRDTVTAYRLLMERGRTGEAYNISTGQCWSMQAVLDRLLALAGLTVTVRPRSDLVRLTDLSMARIDSTKLRTQTGWAPRYTLDQTLADTLAYWRTQ
jgi:GDP-4-dehydro-6-deoxy-D-mannose reductase